MTDHKNLQYLIEAKCLNLRQARWVLFFTKFNFIVTYFPSHKNALSRIHLPDPVYEELELVLPPDLFAYLIIWSLDKDIRATTKEEPAPSGGPESKIYVPTSFHISPLDSVHVLPGSSHPDRQ